MREGKLFEGNILVLEAFQEATLDNGRHVCEACLFELINETIRNPDLSSEVLHDGHKIKTNHVYKGDVKKPENKGKIFFKASY